LSPSATRSFLDAAREAGAVISSPLVGVAWDSPSALAQMTVGALTGHVLLIVRRVGQHLDEEEPTMEKVQPPGTVSWLRVGEAEDLGNAEHRAVRADGDRVAQWGWETVRRSYAERVEGLAARLEVYRPGAVMVGDAVMEFESYLVTRIIELLVHTDDIAVSVGMTPPSLSADAMTLALPVLVDAARSIHGDRAVLRSLSRRERATGPEPSVF
jgi:Mycothiol maleylpyruvate isomerase N-terminal domain